MTTRKEEKYSSLHARLAERYYREDTQTTWHSRIRPTPSPLTSSTDATSTAGPGRCTSTVSRSDYTYGSTIEWGTTTSRRKWHVECWTSSARSDERRVGKASRS